MSDDTTYQQQTLFAEVFPAKTLALPEIARDWLESAADFGSSSFESLLK